MGRLILLLILSALCALVYVNFIRPEDVVEAPLIASKDPAVIKVSAFVDVHLGRIFSKIDGRPNHDELHEIRQLRATIADRKAKASAQEQSPYATAITLCDTLAEAVQERDQCNRSLMDTRSKPYHTSTAADPAKEEEEKRKFFEGGIQHRWAERAASYQKRVSVLYSQLRAQERQ